MSAAKDYLNKKWIDWIVTLMISLFTIITAFNLELFNGLASKEYVDSENKTQTIMFDREIKSVRTEQQIRNESIIMLLNRIDKRTERLEQRFDDSYDK